jgi:uncharacterized protein YgiM (DUF1202 family)
MAAMRRVLLALALAPLLAIAATAIQTGTTTRATELRSTPFADGKLVRSLPAGALVEVHKRVGGWYQVTSNGTGGWVRMWSLRFSTPPDGGSALKQNVAVLQSGRSSSTYTTATTGVRGLSEEELNNAKPNPEAVKALEQLAVAPDDARAFARKAELKADPGLLKGTK